MWQFPFEQVARESKIVLYGAGKVGHVFREQCIQRDWCEIIAWCDQRWETLEEEIVNPQDIMNLRFDVVVIALEDGNTAIEVMEYLQRMGIERKRLIWKTPLKGDKMCPVCRTEIKLFLPAGIFARPNAKCPVCHSLERHRALYLYFEANKNKFFKNMTVLHFAPERIFYNYFSSLDVDYWPVDINENYKGIRKAVDITNMPFENASIDMIVCNHVLEHIPNEREALSEMYRVLRDDGEAIVNVPLNVQLEETLEREEYNTPELRSKYYGQEDHVRVYGMDIESRFADANFKVEVIKISEEYSLEEMVRYGLKKNERIFILSKRR